ncbi:MAG: 3'-5' exonuclease [Acidobacteriota bacterium]|nr:3'-5' exonuclease [Acidobacteriota bacterium]
MTELPVFTAGFTDALNRLPVKERGSVMTTVFRFQENPKQSGLRLHKIKTRSGDVWSISDNMDLRILVVKDNDNWVFVHVDHHDKAYEWAARREIGRNPYTGSFQIFEVEESVKTVERVIERYVVPDQPPLFEKEEDAYLLSLGVPKLWLPTLRRIRDEDHLLQACERLPQDVAERLLDLASGEFVTPPAPVDPKRPLTETPHKELYQPADSREMEDLLREPIETWMAFLHPDQRRLIERDFSGPARVTGAAGTGKTVAAMHRARRAARQGKKVLLTTFTRALTHNLQRAMNRLCGPEEKESITVSNVHKQVRALVTSFDAGIQPAGLKEVAELLRALGLRFASGYDPKFIQAEWDHVVRAQGISSWDGYRRARRTGRGRALGVKDRKQLWRVFGGVLDRLKERNRLDWTGMCLLARDLLRDGRVSSPFDAVIIDEVQDLKSAELQFLAALCKEPGGLMLCGDAGQRIYPGGFSLSALGIETRGRAAVLRINYRTTAHIRAHADRVLTGLDVDDMEGGLERHAAAFSLRLGERPKLLGFSRYNEEITGATAQISDWLAAGLEPNAVGIFARTNEECLALAASLNRAGIQTAHLSKDTAYAADKVGIGAMHAAKGLEFKAVLVSGISRKNFPLQWVYHIQDPLDRQHALDQERRLLYVAMTRARDLLTVTWSEEPSVFLEPVLGIDKR